MVFKHHGRKVKFVFINGDFKNLIKNEIQLRKSQKSFVVWFTGLSGSGKTTLSKGLESWLCSNDFHVYVLDGDNIRMGLNRDLGFTPQDRHENVRRIGEVAHLMLDAGVITLVAFITPYAADRIRVKNMFSSQNFIEVYVKCSLEECTARDPKGLYRKAGNGEIVNFTGVSAPYEIPSSADVIVDTERETIEMCMNKIISYLNDKGYLDKGMRKVVNGDIQAHLSSQV